MKNKFFTFIKPYLSVIDNGKFFRKPFSWLYVIIAIVSLLAPAYLIYNAVNLNNAYQYRERCRIEREIAWKEYQKVKEPYEKARTTIEQKEAEEKNARQNYNQASRNIYSYNYWGGGSTYNQQAADQAKYYEGILKTDQEEVEKASKEIEKLKPSYERTQKEYNSAREKHEGARTQYENIAIMGAFHGKNTSLSNIGIMEMGKLFGNGMQSSNDTSEDFSYESVGDTKAIIALVLYCIAILSAGWINFQIWWDRKSKVNLTSKEDDEFTAAPVVTHYIQTFGESFGTFTAVMGFFTALIIITCNVCFGKFGIRFLDMGYASIIIPIIYGFIIIIVFRVIAEAIKAIFAIANNTRK